MKTQDTPYRGFVLRYTPGAEAGRWWWSVLTDAGRSIAIATDTAPDEYSADRAARRWVDGYLRRIGA